MTEKNYQAKLIKKYKEEGWLVIKIIRCNIVGIPDLLLLKPGTNIKFVEVKGEKGKLSEVQKYRINELNEKGFEAITLAPGSGDGDSNREG